MNNLKMSDARRQKIIVIACLDWPNSSQREKYRLRTWNRSRAIFELLGSRLRTALDPLKNC